MTPCSKQQAVDPHVPCMHHFLADTKDAGGIRIRCRTPAGELLPGGVLSCNGQGRCLQVSCWKSSTSVCCVLTCPTRHPSGAWAAVHQGTSQKTGRSTAAQQERHGRTSSQTTIHTAQLVVVTAEPAHGITAAGRLQIGCRTGTDGEHKTCLSHTHTYSLTLYPGRAQFNAFLRHQRYPACRKQPTRQPQHVLPQHTGNTYLFGIGAAEGRTGPAGSSTDVPAAVPMPGPHCCLLLLLASKDGLASCNGGYYCCTRWRSMHALDVSAGCCLLSGSTPAAV